MSDLKRVLGLLATILLGSLGLSLLISYTNINAANPFYIILLASILFFLGWLFNKSGKKRSNAVASKVISIILFLLLLFIQLDVIRFGFIDKVLTIFSISDLFFYLLYIFSGFLFGE